MAKSLRIKGVAVNPNAPFKNRAGIVASGVFSSLSEADQKAATDELCDALGYKAAKSKPEVVQTEDNEEKPQ